MTFDDALDRDLAAVLSLKAGKTRSGWPYLQEPAWVRFRDWVPHILADGERVLAALKRVQRPESADAAQVVHQVVLTAAITAPPDLWLARYVVAALAQVGLADKLARGESVRADHAGMRAEELAVDLRFLLSRGLLQLTASGAYRAVDDDAVRAVLTLGPLDDARDDAVVRSSAARPLARFAPGPREVVLGARLVPLVLALRVQGAIPALLEAGRIDDAMSARDRETLASAGVIDATGALTETGRRVLERGPGPFGIIAAYRGYLEKLVDIWRGGRGSVWVERGANVAASQDANRATFEKANDALDRWCEATGFAYDVFVEHALGKGEATRQRWQRARAAGRALAYVGADLEDAAIDAAVAEQKKGNLPPDMRFVRRADIGKPALLVDALTRFGLDSRRTVMIVGNGFHEVRQQTDERMIEVLRGYADAGIVILFTEETGLSVEDLLHTAWNTYHAGFKYVHERSGQGLRPAEHAPATALDEHPPLSWAECAERAGYVRLDAYSPRGRTVYPYTPSSGVNPAISVTHFCVPRALLTSLTPAPR